MRYTPDQIQSLSDKINAYNTAIQAYNDFIAQQRVVPGAPTGLAFWEQPQVKQAADALAPQYQDIAKSLSGVGGYRDVSDNIGVLRNSGVSLPQINNYQYGDRTKGLGIAGPILSIGLPLALSAIAPGFGTSIGSTLSSAARKGIGAAVGGAIGGAANGGGIKGSLIDAGISGAGAYLANGGLSKLLDTGTSLSTGSGLSGDFSSGVSGTATDSPIKAAARAASAGPAGGGAAGGFASTVGDAASSNIFDDISKGLSAFADDPVGYAKDSITSGVKDMFSPMSLAKDAMKGGLSYFLQKDNTSGYNALQDAAKAGAANYRPFLNAGVDANNTLADLQGLNGPEAAQAAMAKWQMDPSFTFTRDQGIKALDAGAAKRGMALSGNQVQAVQDYGSGLANTYFQNYLNNLARTSQQGQSAAAGVNEGTMDAATAYALSKANKANNFNRFLSSFI